MKEGDRPEKSGPAGPGHRTFGRGCKGLALAVGLLLSALVSEFTVRLIMPSNKFHVWPPNLHAELRPSAEATPGIVGTSRFTVNSAGIRGRELDPDRPPAYRLLALGGSTTECLYLDDAEAWPFLLEQALQTSDGPSVWVGNVGKSGLNTADYLVHVKYLLPQYPRIDAILLLTGINDLLLLALGQAERLTEREQVLRAFAVVPGRGPWGGPWYKQTELYDILRRLRARVYNAGATTWQQDEIADFYKKKRAERRARSATIDQLPDLTSHLTEYSANLNAIVDSVQSRAAKVVFMTQPTLWRKNLNHSEDALLWMGWRDRGKAYYSTAALAEAMELYNRRLLDVCRSRRLDCIDLARLIPPTVETFYDDAHFTEAGAQLVARVVSAHFMRRPPFMSGRSHDQRSRRFSMKNPVEELDDFQSRARATGNDERDMGS